ncbi:MAG: AAA family ATPase [Nanoarchaeota archaeon]
MLLKRIKIENIRSYENAEIVFPKGSVLLSGDIGAGKTSILLSIEFALFGLQPGQKGSSLLKNGKDSGIVELEFEIEGKNIIITRTLKRKKTISQEESFISIDGKSEEKAVTELKNTILQLLNYPLEFAKKTNLLYRFTVYTPQEEMKQIILENPESRLNTLRHVFGIDKYKRIKENLSILTAKLRELSRLKQGELSDLDSKKERLTLKRESIMEINTKLPEIEFHISTILQERLEKEKSIEEVKTKIDEKRKLENEVEKTNIFILGKKDQLSKAVKDINSIKKKLEEFSKDFDENSLIKATQELKEKNVLKEQLNKEVIELSTKISSLITKQYELEKVKEKIANLKICPTCLQEVNENHKHGIFDQTEKEISLIKNERINFDTERQKKEISLSSFKSEILELEKQKNYLEVLKIKIQTIKDDSKKLEDLEKSKISMENDIELLEKQLLTLRTDISELRKFEPIIQSREKELADVILKEREIEIKKAQIVKEIELLNKETLILEKEIEEKEKAKVELIYIMELETWLASDFLELVNFIEKNVMLQLKNQFSKLFNEWFSILVPDTFQVRLDEQFTPIIEQQTYELDYDYLSGGERTAIALAYRLALNQTINSFLSEIKTKGIVILDEPTDGFSQQQLDKMRDVLKELNFDQLIIVSHDPKIESFVDNVIRLNKQEGISSIS